MKKQMAVLKQKRPVSYNLKDGWTYEHTEWEVEVMATAGIYAMVRRKGCSPVVAQLKELALIDPPKSLRYARKERG